jgi:hypothetical protein
VVPTGREPAGVTKSGRSEKFDLEMDFASLPIMKGEFTAIIEEAPEGGFWAICPEVPGANGQGETIDEAKDNLREAIRLIF